MKRLLLLAIVLVGCGPRAQAPEKPREPGLYGQPHYACAGIGCNTNIMQGTVGIPYQAAVYVNCVGGGWYANASVETGQLPPGLSMSSDGTISGVPTLAGDWNFTVRFAGMMCNGNSYGDDIVTMKIVTTGS